MPPDVRETAAGLQVFAVTGGLSNEWQLTLPRAGRRTGDACRSRLTAMPGVMFLTDPELEPIGRVLPWLVLGDPLLARSRDRLAGRAAGSAARAAYDAPGLQLRPLSPVLPVRRGA